MAISKVIYKASAQATPETWMDSTPATAAAEDITAPKTAMLADGVLTTGTGTGGGGGGGSDAEDGIIDRTISGNYTNSRVTSIGVTAFQYCANLTAVGFPVCTSIGGNAFQHCTNLIAVSFPVCTSIASSAFYNCANLTAVSFPVCTSIASSAFYSCSRLSTVNAPLCQNIGPYAFGRCSSLNAISFPSCASLGQYAFQSCRILLSAYFLGSSVPYLSNGAFASTPIAGTTTSTGGVYGSIYVRASLLTAFQSASLWSNYSSRMVGLTDAQIAEL